MVTVLQEGPCCGNSSTGGVLAVVTVLQEGYSLW